MEQKRFYFWNFYRKKPRDWSQTDFFSSSAVCASNSVHLRKEKNRLNFIFPDRKRLRLKANFTAIRFNIDVSISFDNKTPVFYANAFDSIPLFSQYFFCLQNHKRKKTLCGEEEIINQLAHCSLWWKFIDVSMKPTKKSEHGRLKKKLLTYTSTLWHFTATAAVPAAATTMIYFDTNENSRQFLSMCLCSTHWFWKRIYATLRHCFRRINKIDIW